MMPGNNSSDLCGVEPNFPSPNMGGFHGPNIGNNANAANVFKNQAPGMDVSTTLKGILCNSLLISLFSFYSDQICRI